MRIRTDTQVYIECVVCGKSMSGVWLHKTKKYDRARVVASAQKNAGSIEQVRITVDIAIHEDCVLALFRMLPPCEERVRDEIEEWLKGEETVSA